MLEIKWRRVPLEYRCRDPSHFVLISKAWSILLVPFRRMK